MKRARFLIPIALSLLLSALAVSGCFGENSAKTKVDRAIMLVESSQPLLEDLLSLDERINTLGTRFTNVDDTIAEGKSLAEMALMDVDELESRYTEARDLFLEVVDMDGAGDYAAYSFLALVAVNKELEAFAVNRRLLTSVWDMLDVLPLAESQEQLSFYIEEIDGLVGEVSDLMQQGAEAAIEADSYHKEHGL
jgi:hypothetical protein